MTAIATANFQSNMPLYKLRYYIGDIYDFLAFEQIFFSSTLVINLHTVTVQTPS